MRKLIFLFAVGVSAQNYTSNSSGVPISRTSFLRSQGFNGKNIFGDSSLLLYFPNWELRGAGPFYDLSGNGFLGTQTGTNQGIDRGKTSRYAPYFNGTVPNVVNVSPTPTITIPFTVAAWVQPQNPTSAYPRVVESYYTTGFFIGGDSTGKWTFVIKNTFITSAGSITKGGWPNTPWTFLVGTYDGTNMNLYINGTLASGPTAASSPGTQSIALAIGGCSSAGISGCASPGNANGWWDGQIGSVRIWTRTLTSAEVLAIYNAENH